MSVINRVWDTMAGPGFVPWKTPRADDSGTQYPGPGTFGTHTSDYCVEGEVDDQALAVPVSPTLTVPVGVVQGLWLFDGGLTDESPNAITLSVSGLTAKYAPSPTPAEKGFFKATTGFLVDSSVDVAMQIGGAMTGELMFRPHRFMDVGIGGGAPFVFGPSQTGAVGTSNIPWIFSLEENTNQFEYLHEYAGGGASNHRVQSGVIIVPGRWHHLAFTRDAAGTLIRMYVNGHMVHREVVANAPAPGVNARLLVGDETGGTVRADGHWGWARITDDEFRPEDILASARATLPPELRP